jgi:hypothetical protein
MGWKRAARTHVRTEVKLLRNSDTALAMSQENVELIREANKVWSADPLNPPFEYFDPEIEWETRWPGLPRWFHGHDGLKDWVEGALEPMQIQIDLIAARSVDEEMVLAEYRVRGRGRGSGIGTEMPIFDLYWVRNGLVCRRRTFRSEEEALEAAGLRE